MKNALLIGSATYGLCGPERDLELMEDILQPRNFKTVSLKGPGASRAGILEAFEKLIRDSKSGDSALVHYSGHGCLIRNPIPRADPRTTPYQQFLIPTDFNVSSEHDFRGLLDVELSILLERLTEKTRNVVLILDCCHAAGLGRPSMWPRALVDPLESGLPQHLAALRCREQDQRRFAGGNPNVVRLSAAGTNQEACEYDSPDHGRVGLLTESLYLAFQQVGNTPISWQTLGKWVRERVLLINMHQRPELEGPARRLLFDLKEGNQVGTLELFYDQKKPFLRGGRLHGLKAGDSYGLTPLYAEHYDPATGLGEARVCRVHGGVAEVRLTMPGAPPGARAFPLRLSFPEQHVHIKGDPPEALLQGMAASGFLKRGHSRNGNPLMATICISRQTMQLRDDTGLSIGPPSQNPQPILKNLEILARARALSTLTSGADAAALPPDAYCLHWGQIIDRQVKHLPESGSNLHLGDKIYAYVKNTGVQPLFISMFNLGLDRSIALMSHRSRSGIEVVSGDDLWLGFDPYTGVCDWRLTWPKHLSKEQPRSESLVVVISDKPQDLSALETSGVTYREIQQPSQLQLLVSGMGRRPMRHAQQPVCDVCYAVHHLVFHVDPGNQK